MKYLSKLLTAGCLVLVFFAGTSRTYAQAALPEREALIAELLTKIAELQKQLAELNQREETPALIVAPGAQPGASLVIAGAQSIPFTVVTLTAQGQDVTVNGLTVTQSGPGSDSALYFLGMIDGGYVNMPHSDHTYEITDAFTIPKGETKEITLYATAANDLTGFEGQMLRLSLSGISTDVPISGSLPIVGTFHSVTSTLSVGTMTGTRGSYDPGTNRNLTINSTDVIFSGVRYQVGSTEPITIKSIRWRQDGSAATSDIKNLKTVLEYRGAKTVVPAESDPAEPRYYDADFGDGITISKGDSFELYVQGDVGLGVGRTIDFNVDSNDDLYGVGMLYGFDVAPQSADVSGAPAEGQTSDLSDPYYNAYQHTIEGASGTIQKA